MKCQTRIGFNLKRFAVLNMSKFGPNKDHSRTVILFCFHLKNTVAESYRMLREDYGEYAPSQDTCERWFRRFKSGDFVPYLTEKEHRKTTKKSTKIQIFKH